MESDNLVSEIEALKTRLKELEAKEEAAETAEKWRGFL
jgi:hypothetical protein